MPQVIEAPPPQKRSGARGASGASPQAGGGSRSRLLCKLGLLKKGTAPSAARALTIRPARAAFVRCSAPQQPSAAPCRAPAEPVHVAPAAALTSASCVRLQPRNAGVLKALDEGLFLRQVSHAVRVPLPAAAISGASASPVARRKRMQPSDSAAATGRPRQRVALADDDIQW